MRYIVLTPLTPNHPALFETKKEAIEYFKFMKDSVKQPDLVRMFTFVREMFPEEEEELLASHKCVNYNA